jgi:hypothetical protein
VGNYRPITDVWILGRPKVKYHGSFPGGFLHRARALLGVGPRDAVLHVCAGKVREYPYRGLGREDETVDIDPMCKPDHLRDVRLGLPFRTLSHSDVKAEWDACLIDRPYSAEDAAKYAGGADVLPPLNALLKAALAVVPVGRCVGVLDYKWPRPPRDGAREVAIVAVTNGRDANMRTFSVWERLA